MITRSDQIKQLEENEKKKIYLYDLIKVENEINKGNETVKVLYDLLLKEINRHNGVINRKMSSIRNQGFSD
jgi:septation ring formation regulator EzrA